MNTHGPSVHLICASGGNAGLAAACAANSLGLKCTVYTPEGLSQKMLDFIQKERAEVILTGKYYLHALRKAEEAVAAEEHAYVAFSPVEASLK